MAGVDITMSAGYLLHEGRRRRQTMRSPGHATDDPVPATPAATAGAGAMLAGEAVARLGSLTVLQVTGADATTFLQGQLTADVGDVGTATSRLAAWCSPKGRVLATFRLIAAPAGGGYLLVCERWFVAKLLARLRMFILRATARIEDVGGKVGVAGVAGTRALPGRVAGWARGAGVDDATVFDVVAIARVPGRHPRFIVVGPHVSIASVAAPRDGRARRADDRAWRLADICAGVAEVGEDSSDAFVPQMLNLERLRAVSFEKGCYVGQEIVARTQHLGRIKRRTYVGRTAAAIAPGAPIVDAARGEAPKVGEVIAAQPHPEGGSAASVVLNIESAPSPALRVDRPGGARIRISPPDYMEPSG